MKILVYLLLSVPSIGMLLSQNVIKDVSSTDIEKTFRSLNMDFEFFDVEEVRPTLVACKSLAQQGNVIPKIFF